jgi:hypothetical protein
VETLSLTIGILGVLSTAVLGFIAYQLSLVNQRYSARRTIGDLHSEMARLRCAYPEIRTVCRGWDDLHRKRMYGDPDSAAQALSGRELALHPVCARRAVHLGLRSRRGLHPGRLGPRLARRPRARDRVTKG